MQYDYNICVVPSAQLPGIKEPINDVFVLLSSQPSIHLLYCIIALQAVQSGHLLMLQSASVQTS